jgi:excisionase family DNA binding protein
VNDKVTEKWSSMKEIQKHLGVGRDSILHWIETRDMPAYKLGRLWKFKLSEVDEWIRSGGADERYDEQDEK